MGELLETVMLVCFGASWPLSVYKNMKSHTAKSMSLPFILLIIGGYVAGICAKCAAHNYSYVLVVYIINLAAVLTNLVVYFINRSYDRQEEREIAGSAIEGAVQL